LFDEARGLSDIDGILVLRPPDAPTNSVLVVIKRLLEGDIQRRVRTGQVAAPLAAATSSWR
jgi:hypothetical protein